MSFRKQVRICGELFDIDQVEGGKLRASSIKLPGFELVEANHNLLRMRMQKALAEYDRQMLLGVNTQDCTFSGFITLPPPLAAAGPNYANGSGLNVFVEDNGIQRAIPCGLTQLVGIPGLISEHGIEYKQLRYRSANVGALLARLDSHFNVAKARGATDIVWRLTPEITPTPDGAAPWQIYARLHFLPHSANAYINWTPSGTPAMII